MNFPDLTTWPFTADEPEEDQGSAFILYVISIVALWSSLWTTGCLHKACLSCLHPRIIYNCLKRICEIMSQESDTMDSQLRQLECMCTECNRMKSEASRIVRCPGAPRGRGRGRGQKRGQAITPKPQRRKKKLDPCPSFSD